MTTPDTLSQAATGFANVARTIRSDQWDLPTPCDDWSVRQLIGHVAAGSEMFAALVDGASRDQAIALLSVDHLGDDPIAALDRALERQQDAAQRPDVAAMVLHHPAGDMPGSLLLDFRSGDIAAHQWDLARAIGADDTLDPVLADELWASLEPLVPLMAASGVFGAGSSGDLPDDAPAQLRILDAMGRRP